jgi:hypothetical protein
MKTMFQRALDQALSLAHAAHWEASHAPGLENKIDRAYAWESTILALNMAARLYPGKESANQEVLRKIKEVAGK